MNDPATLTSAVSPSVDEGPVAEPFGHPTDTFDVEPPYTPDAAAIEAVEKYDDRFIDREISWVHFNQRVLELAEDPDLPLLERARFLAIFASNLDEFFMVRVAGLKRRIAAGVAVRAASGLMPREQLEQLWTSSRELMERHAQALVDLLPELGGHGIEILRWSELDREEQKVCKKLFKDRIFPVLTPLAVDPAHPFPYISGLSLNLAVVVRHPETGTEHFARVKVPPTFGRFVGLGNQRFVPIEDVIGEHLKKLFPGMDVLGAHTFRVTRNEDLEVEEDDAENLLKALEKELQRRRFGPPVRLEVEQSMDPKVLDLLVSELGVGRDEVVSLPGPLDLTGLHSIADLPRDDLKYAAFLPTTHPSLAEVESSSPVDVFDSVARHDVLLHLSANELWRGPTPDRMAALSSHVLGQRSFYPLFPPPLGACLDTSHAAAVALHAAPDVLVLPSNLAPFAKLVALAPEALPGSTPAKAAGVPDAVVAVNPGRLSKGVSGGSFAHVVVVPGDRPLHERMRVDIRRL